MNRLMIAATGSGCGKTTVACALMAAFAGMGKKVAAFKCGPDYIDPMFHKKAALTRSYNLDMFLMGEDGVRYGLMRHSQGADLSIIEGVMGLYDGAGCGSSHELARLTGTPVVLVADVRGKAESVCAELYGYLNYERNNIAAVILNNTTEGMFAYYKEMIEGRLSVPVAGFMPKQALGLGSRHLGLITADEVDDIRKRIAVWAAAAARHIDLERLLAISRAEPVAAADGFLAGLKPEGCPRIYVAEDEAFNFYYEDNHELLRAYGAQLCFFSPLRDRELPDDADGLVLWGGYPELYARELAGNADMKASICRRIKGGMPVYAECGGFMYLTEYLTDADGETHAMLGVLPGGSRMTDRLQNFGYAELTANRDNMLCDSGYGLRAHSFHYSASDTEGTAFTARRRRGSYQCITAERNIFAGYPHIHFWGGRELARRLVRAAVRTEARHGVHIGSGGD